MTQTSPLRWALQLGGERAPVYYPDSDGRPMADNTKQYEWMVTIRENLDQVLPDFVAANLLWYPVEGHPEIRQSPDVLVALGRPKGHRGSYRQWEEAGVPPQVVFEIQSPGNSAAELVRKTLFYARHGVEELYLYDPDHHVIDGWTAREGALQPVPAMDGWVSPRTGMRFEMGRTDLHLFRPDGSRFRTYAEAELALRQAEAARNEAEAARNEAEAARIEAVSARGLALARAEALEARLRELGVDPAGIL